MIKQGSDCLYCGNEDSIEHTIINPLTAEFFSQRCRFSPLNQLFGCHDAEWA